MSEIVLSQAIIDGDNVLLYSILKKSTVSLFINNAVNATCLINHGLLRYQNTTTALCRACYFADCQVVRDIINCGAEVNITEDAEFTPLHVACGSQVDRLNKINLLLNYDKTLMVAKNKYSELPLHRTALCGYCDALTLFLDLEIDVETRGQFDRTPMHFAAEGAQENCVATLVKWGGNIDARDQYDNTPLHLASYHGHIRVMQVLLDNGVKTDSRNKDQYMPLHNAADCGRRDAVQLLLQKGADVNIYANKCTPLHLASTKGNAEVVKLLTGAGAVVNACEKDEDAWTSLHIAAQSGHLEIIQILLEKGAYVGVLTSTGETRLHIAAYNGHADVVKTLIANGAECNERNKNVDYMPLHWAALHRHLDVVKILLNSGADVHACNSVKWTPLFLAAQNEKQNNILLEELLKWGGNVNARDNDCDTVLHIASQNGNRKTAQLILDHGAEVDPRNSGNYTPLHLSAHNGHVELIQLLLHYGANINECGNGEWTALHFASQNGHIKLAEVLINHGSDIDARLANRCTPLHVATQHGQPQLMKLLLENGANANASDEFEWTPAHVASKENMLNEVELLLEGGADVHARQQSRSMPLHIAAEEGHVEMSQVLLKHGADVNAEGKNKWTPLHFGVYNKHREVVQVLIENGAKVNLRDGDGCTPLYLSTFLKDNAVDLAQLLVKHGADTNICTPNHATPLHIAAEYGNTDLVNVLLDAGANIDAQKTDGGRPLHFASQNGHTETLEVLLERGALVDAGAVSGVTSLHLSCLNGNTDVVHKLIRHDAGVKIRVHSEERSNSHRTPLHIASQVGAKRIARKQIEFKRAQNKIQHLLENISSSQPAASYAPTNTLSCKNRTNFENETDRSESEKNKPQTEFSQANIMNCCEDQTQANAAFAESDVCVSVARMYKVETASENILDVKHKQVFTYNVSAFLRQIQQEKINHEELEEAILAIDNKVTIRPKEEVHKEVAETIEIIINNICTKVRQKDSSITDITYLPTGSFFTGFKVALPYEADFVLIVNYVDNKQREFKELCSLICEVIEKENEIHEKSACKIHAINQQRVCITLAMESKIPRHECDMFGCTVDLVPAYKITTDVKNTVKYTKKAEKYLESHDLSKNSISDLVTLLSPSRDYKYDTGLLVNRILEGLKEETKSGYRVAKYVLQNRIHHSFPQYRHLMDKSKTLELYGYGSIVRSFHLRLCFLHLLIELHDSDIRHKFTPSVLTLCLLDMMQNTYLNFAKYRISVESEKRTAIVAFLDPLINDDSLEYRSKDGWVGQGFENVARLIREVIQNFKSDVSSRRYLNYTLHNYNKFL